jgi:exosortase E/protease (VPEID-CTERM system)
LSTEIALSHATQEKIPLPYVRWAGLVLLLVAELVALSCWFDTGVLGDNTWSELLVGQTPLLLRIGVCMGAATLLVGGPRLWQTIAGRYHSGPFPWPFFLAHVAAFALLATLTSLVLERGLAASPRALAWLGLWLAAGLLTLTTWALSAMPARTWQHLGKSCWPALVAGTAAGLVAFLFGLVTAEFWKPLGQGTLWLVFYIADLVFGNAILDSANFVVGTSSFSVSIAPECSGYEGIGLIAAFCGIYLWVFRLSFRFPHALLLVPIGMLAIWICNALRIVLLIGLGSHGWEGVAVGGFHSQAGWLAFNAVALGLVFFSDRIRFVAADLKSASAAGAADLKSADSALPADCKSAATTTAPAYLAPFLTAIATAMIAGAFAADFEWLYPLRVVAVLGVLWVFRHSYANLGWAWSWQAFTLGVFTFLIWVMLTPGKPGAEFQRGGDLSYLPPGWALVWLSIRFLGFVVAVPLCEELAFRGYLTRRLQAADFNEVPLGRFSWLSFLGSSVLFGALHGQYWFAGILAGALFALALYRRGRMGDAVLAHVTANALIAVCGVTDFSF